MSLIKINNENMMNHLHDIGIHVDHAIINDDYVQFVVSEYDLEKIINSNINFEIIHDNVEEFYQSRLVQNYSMTNV